jgi:hypothetical protein
LIEIVATVDTVRADARRDRACSGSTVQQTGGKVEIAQREP